MFLPRYRFLARAAVLGASMLLAAPTARAAPRRYFPRAPQLRIQSWVHGQATSLEALRGKVVLIDFFQIICPGCEISHPMVEELQRKYGPDGFQVLGLACAFEHEDAQTPALITQWVKERDFGYPVAIDEEMRTTFDIYGAEGTPYVALIDRQGRLRAGGFFEREPVESRVQALLKEPAP